VEINGFGYIDRYGNDFQLEDVFILKQTVSAGHAENEPEDISDHMTHLLQNGGDPGRIRFQWHSHVHMGAYFSGVDTGNIDRYNGEWMLSLVANKFGQFSARLDVYRPFRVWTPVTVMVQTQLTAAHLRMARREITDKVRQQNAVRKTKVKPTAEVSSPIDPLVLTTGGKRS
jgi:hypothetical protein